MQISEGLEPIELWQYLQFVFRHIKAGKFSQSVDFLRQTGKLIMVQPELWNTKDFNIVKPGVGAQTANKNKSSFLESFNWKGKQIIISFDLEVCENLKFKKKVVLCILNTEHKPTF